MTTPAQVPTHLHTMDDESLVIVEDVFDDEDDDEVDEVAPTSPSPASQELGSATSLCADAGVEMGAPGVCAVSAAPGEGDGSGSRPVIIAKRRRRCRHYYSARIQ